MRLDFSTLAGQASAALACGTVSFAAAAQPAPAVEGALSSAESGSTMTAPVLTGGDDADLSPRGNLWELGIFGGLLFASNRSALHDPREPAPEFEQPSPEVGVRVAYLPLSFLGVEGEFMGAAAQLSGAGGAIVWGGRGHLLFQVPTQVSPFVLIGGGRMGIVSDASGNDDDPALHFGGGLKVHVHRRVALRVDVRDTITKQRPASDTAHHIEALAGLSLVFGRPAPRPKDSDADGIIDMQDSCPFEQGLQPDGCPVRDRDRDGVLDRGDECPVDPGVAPTGCPDEDGDGVLDRDDQCLGEAGTAPTGCPDKDGDGVLDRADQCLDVPGVMPTGCPADTDSDGLTDAQDKCPKEAENLNGFEDEDGCPDEMPEAVAKFTGVIPGIEFETGRSEIRGTSTPVLDNASAVLVRYPTLKVMIVGHTDNVGSHATNVELSRRRAEAVKAYLMKRGVEASRIETRGEGPDSPVASNATRAGRQANRRIEFQIIK